MAIEMRVALQCDAKVVKTMLWTIAAILLALWFFGILTGNTLAGLLHVLLVLALITSVIQLVASRHMSER